MLDSFSKTYTEARSQFLEAAAETDAKLGKNTYGEWSGPSGEQLATDVATIGGVEPEHALIVISGTHGVEGFCGSACQTAWLRQQYQHRSLGRTTIYFVHALNPYGFAWFRRVTPDNVDLNRNFLDSFSGALPDNDAYSEFHHLLNLQEEKGDEVPSLPAELLTRLQTPEGARAFKAAVGKGQYAFPEGIIFGGKAADPSNVFLRGFVDSLPGTIRNGIVLDFHTGLGTPGTLELFTEESSRKFLQMQQWFAGRKVTTLGDEASLGYRITGSVYRAFTAPDSNTPWHCAALEFGTKPLPVVLAALRADNWLHTKTAGTSPLREAIQQRMADAFAIADQDKASVLNTGLAVIDEALRALRRI